MQFVPSFELLLLKCLQSIRGHGRLSLLWQLLWGPHLSNLDVPGLLD